MHNILVRLDCFWCEQVSKCIPKHVRLITCKHPTCHFSPSFLSQRFSLFLAIAVTGHLRHTFYTHSVLPSSPAFPTLSLWCVCVCVCVCVCARARTHPHACVHTHVWVGGVLQHIISNSSLYKSILLPYLLLNTCKTEWCMHCMHVFVWCCERAGFVWKFLCFMHTFSLIHSSFMYEYK